MNFTELIYLESPGHTATITLNRPERMNGWTPTMEAEFRRAIELASANDEVRAIIVTGAGRTFCTGADMGRLSGAAVRPTQVIAQPSAGNFDQRYSYLMNLTKPLIAAINGSVAGVGLCITLYCDIRYMADGAKLSTAFARRGLIAEHGSSWLLPRLVGPMNAADLLLSGRSVSASEAESMGLVRKLPAENFLETVLKNAQELSTLSSPRSVGIIKRQLRDAYFQSLAEAIIFADVETSKCRDTADFKEGVASFIEKRQPNFTGN